MTLITPPELVRISEAARILGVCIKTLQNWDQQGKFKPLRSPGKHRFYRTAELEQLLRQRQEERK